MRFVQDHLAFWTQPGQPLGYTSFSTEDGALSALFCHALPLMHLVPSVTAAHGALNSYKAEILGLPCFPRVSWASMQRTRWIFHLGENALVARVSCKQECSCQAFGTQV